MARKSTQTTQADPMAALFAQFSAFMHAQGVTQDGTIAATADPAPAPARKGRKPADTPAVPRITDARKRAINTALASMAACGITRGEAWVILGADPQYAPVGDNASKPASMRQIGALVERASK